MGQAPVRVAASGGQALMALRQGSEPSRFAQQHGGGAALVTPDKAPSVKPLIRPGTMVKIRACDVLMQDGTWSTGGEILGREGLRALVRWDGLSWWAQADEWRPSDA